MSRISKLVLNACLVSILDLAGIFLGFLAWHSSGLANQIAVQLPVALAISIGGVVLWLIRFSRIHRLDPERDAIVVFLLCFPCCAVIFTVVHYFTQGYLTAFGNILGIWIFAFAANLPALALAAASWRRAQGSRAA